MTSVPRDIATPPPPEREDPLPRNPKTVPAKRNGLPETRRYTYAPKPVPPGAPEWDGTGEHPASIASAESHAMSYHCPCGGTAVVDRDSQTVRPQHRDGCLRDARLRRMRARAGRNAA